MNLYFDLTPIAIQFGWLLMLFGILYGALLGLFFHNEEWLGGYSSFRRRLFRLGHISCFGIGMLLILYGLSIEPLSINQDPHQGLALAGFTIAGLMMPLTCIGTAIWKPFRFAFPIPVLAAFTGIFCILVG